MFFLIKKGFDPSIIKEKFENNSVSFKLINLYDRSIFLAWPENLAEKIEDISIELKMKSKNPYILADKTWKGSNTIIRIKDVEIGNSKIQVAAGPCSVEDEELLIEEAKELKRMGVSILRGGAYKPRTSPYTFQGLGEKGIRILRRVSDETGLPIISEILDPRDIELFKEYIDILQIGARNSQNYPLLREIGKSKKPCLLKRGFGNTFDEWLSSAEYILQEGNGSVILCERGIRTFESSTRFTLDIAAIALAKMKSHLPVCADPSHPAGKRNLVLPLALASIAVGADMLLIEVHHEPEKALSDSEQQIPLKEFSRFMDEMRKVARAIGREL